MRVLLLIAALAMAAPAFAAIPAPPAAPMLDAKDAVPNKPFQMDDSIRRLAPHAFASPAVPRVLNDDRRIQIRPNKSDPTDRAGPEIR
jgi:hypothetical protein